VARKVRRTIYWGRDYSQNEEILLVLLHPSCVEYGLDPMINAAWRLMLLLWLASVLFVISLPWWKFDGTPPSQLPSHDIR
jgi:hypothetical protein